MPNLNRVMLMGNLTRDPELRYLPNNTAVVNFAIAMNRRWRSQDGEQREETTFVDCSAFSRTAEVINQYLKKGRPIFIEGRLRQERWQDKESGANRSKLSIVVESFEFLDSRGGDAASGSDVGAGTSGGSQSYAKSGASVGAEAQTTPHEALGEADIPF